MPLPGKPRNDFNAILVETVEETITNVLGESVAPAIFFYLDSYLGVRKDQIPYRLNTLFSALENIFGPDGKTLEKAIVRKLYVKLSLQFVERPDKELLQYVEEAIDQFISRK